MKKTSLFIIALMMLLLSGCGKNENPDFNKTYNVEFYDLILEMPQAFTVDNDNGNEYIQFYSYDDGKEKYNYCSLSLSISDYPNDNMRDAVKDGMMVETDFTYTEKNINGYNWSIGYREEDVKFNHTFYVINNYGKEYSLSYEDFGSGNKCADALEVIEKNMTFK